MYRCCTPPPPPPRFRFRDVHRSNTNKNLHPRTTARWTPAPFFCRFPIIVIMVFFEPMRELCAANVRVEFRSRMPSSQLLPYDTNSIRVLRGPVKKIAFPLATALPIRVHDKIRAKPGVRHRLSPADSRNGKTE